MPANSSLFKLQQKCLHENTTLTLLAPRPGVISLQENLPAGQVEQPRDSGSRVYCNAATQWKFWLKFTSQHPSGGKKKQHCIVYLNLLY